MSATREQAKVPERANRGATTSSRRRKGATRRAVVQIVVTIAAVAWMLPLLWAFYTSLRPYAETARKGYVSWPDTLSFQNYTTAWSDGGMGQYFLNSLIVTIPAVIVVLMLSACAAFVLSRYSFKFNIALLMFFTAANLLPQQVIITPVYRLFLQLGLYNSYLGLVVINVAFQMGFCVFVLSNFMRALPAEMMEAARMDGAGVWRQFWQIVLPLTRPALAALATLQFAWIYNDFFWAIMLVRDGDKLPVTSALNNLQGSFFVDNNLVAAGAILVALPTVLVYVLLQKHFVSGLTMGAEK